MNKWIDEQIPSKNGIKEVNKSGKLGTAEK